MTITLYDVPSKRQENYPWNPNVWKTRYSLAYKNLPFKTVWLEFPLVEQTLKELGASPTSTKPDGSPYYTVPTIHDSATNRVISDSYLIAKYLDETYPSRPLFPKGTNAFHAAFDELFPVKIQAIAPFLIPSIARVLNPGSEEYFRRTRKVMFGADLEELFPAKGTERRATEWKKLEEGFGELDKSMNKDEVLVMGGQAPCYADFIVAGWLISFRVVFGASSEEWRNVMKWHQGRWERLMKALKQYEDQAVRSNL